MEGALLMSYKERDRKSAFDTVSAGKTTLKKASVLLRLSYRHCRRSYKRFLQEGDAGLVHRRRGKPSNRGKPAGFKKRVLELYAEKYDGFGPTLAAEKLLVDGYEVNHETLRRWLIAEGKWQNRRKRRQHRTRRERRSHFGDLVQVDGSHHRWFGPENPENCLMNMVDDATGKTLSLLDEEETTSLAMRTLWLWIERYGIPVSLYADRKNVFVTNREPTLEEQLAGKKPLTAFGKACLKLGIEIISANSPQAKGRVERNHAVYQDRFVKELKLEGISAIDGANGLLAGGFSEHLNGKFAVEPADKKDFHRSLDKSIDLAEIFCFEEARVVQNDWVIRYKNRHFQITRENRPIPKPRTKVIVRELLDGTIRILCGGKKLKFKSIGKEGIIKKNSRKEIPMPKSKYIPAKDHPCRNGFKQTEETARI